MRAARLVRGERWWAGKVAPLVGIAALAALPDAVDAPGPVDLALLLASAAGIAAFGHVLNDLADRRADAAAGKANPIAGRPVGQVVGLLVGSLALGLVPWAWLDAPASALPLLAIELLLLITYSLPPTRWKVRGAPGVIADAAYAYVVPLALVVAVFAAPGAWPPAALALLVGWSALLGLRGILCHQLDDVEADRAAGSRTLILRIGSDLGLRLAADALLPVELALGIGLVAVVASTVGWWFAAFVAAYVGWRCFQGRYLREPPVLPLRGRAARLSFLGYVLGNELIERWLPLVAAVAVALEQPRWWFVVAIVLVATPNGARELLADDLARIPDAVVRAGLDVGVARDGRRTAAARRRSLAAGPREVPAEDRERRRFVFVVCGAASHLDTLDRALRELRPRTALEVWVVTDPARNARPIDPAGADRVVEVATPPELDHHQASIWLKTSLPERLPEGEWCYLDTDVVAVAPGAEAVFDARLGPVAFASDVTYPGQVVDCFSPWALECGCLGLVEWCPHLRQELHERFGLDVPGDWLHWNGGVFAFGPEARPFFARWHEWAVASFGWPGWRTRDQGTLIATAWSLGLQDAARLPHAFNFIVDLDNGELRFDAEQGWRAAADGAWVHPRLLHLYTSPLEDPRWDLGRDVERVLLRRGALVRHEERKVAARAALTRFWWDVVVTLLYRRLIVHLLYWRGINRGWWALHAAVVRAYWRTHEAVHRAYWSVRKAVEFVIAKTRRTFRRLRPSRVRASWNRRRGVGAA